MRKQRIQVENIVACLIGAFLTGCISIDRSPPSRQLQPWEVEPEKKGWSLWKSESAAISGDGYFIVRTIKGEVLYTRQPNIVRSNLRYLTDFEENTLLPPIEIPSDLDPDADLMWDEGGTLYVGREGVPEKVLGTVVLATFWRPERLVRVYMQHPGSKTEYFRATPEAGPPRIGPPGTGGRGLLRPGYREWPEMSE